jgi:protein-S-isoprenylcysteine O-methyltransferase Ste14
MARQGRQVEDMIQEIAEFASGSGWTPLALGCGLLAITAVKSLWLRIAHGVRAHVIDYRDPVHGFVGRLFSMIVGGLLVYFVVIPVWPEVEAQVGLVPVLNHHWSRSLGSLVMAASVLWTGYAQLRMGRSWRIGIPQDTAPDLRTNGPFSMSRNPIFLGMLGFVTGAAVWSPTAVTLVFLAMSYVSLEVQIRGEEAYLERQHGDAYRDYRARVRRWI